MPIIIPEKLPAYSTLNQENIFIMNDKRAGHQDIRPLKIIIFNLMPNKIETETQLLRLLGNTPLQTEITFLNTATYKSKNTHIEHLESFYKTFEEVKKEKFDGMIITGAPVETMEFEEVHYWKELSQVMEFSKNNVTSTLHICWASQAGLYYHYGINKYPLKEKMFGIFPHKVLNIKNELVRGFDDEVLIPHSRHTTILKEELEKINNLELLLESSQAGVCLISTKDKKQVFISGHAEYDRNTIKEEYLRDLNKGLNINLPFNYFINNKVEEGVKYNWRSHAHLLFSNWLNYYVYQETPYILK